MVKLKFYLLLIAPIIFAAGLSLGWNEPRALNEPDGPPANAEDTTPAEGTVNEGEPVEADVPQVEIKKQRPWQAPNYSGQEGALGWSPDAFKVPPKLEERVNFWKDVYTKYT